MATVVAPIQVTLELPQLNTPAREIPTVAPVQLPGLSTIVPRSRSWTRVKLSGLATAAETFAICVAARAGCVPSTHPRIAAAMLARAAGRTIPSSWTRNGPIVRLAPEWLIFGQP